VRPPKGLSDAADDPNAAPLGSSEYVTDGFIPHINLRDMKLKDILKAVLKPLNLDYTPQQDFVWISSPEKIRGETFEDLEAGSAIPAGKVQRQRTEQRQSDEDKSSELAAPSDTSEGTPQEGDASAPSDLVIHVDEALSPLEKKLEIVTNVTFVEQIHLIDFVEHIIEGHGINIMIDGRAVRPPKGKGDSVTQPDGTPHEYVTDGNIPYVNFKNMRLRDILTATLRPMKLVYSVQPGFIWITTPERLKSETFEVLETRTYWMRPKLFNALFEEGAETVTNFVIFPEGEKPETVISIVESDDFPFLPNIVDPVTGKVLSYARYLEGSRNLTAYNSPTNLDNFEAHLKKTGDKILAEE
jgi:hypothetical protein